MFKLEPITPLAQSIASMTDGFATYMKMNAYGNLTERVVGEYQKALKLTINAPFQLRNSLVHYEYSKEITDTFIAYVENTLLEEYKFSKEAIKTIQSIVSCAISEAYKVIGKIEVENFLERDVFTATLTLILSEKIQKEYLMPNTGIFIQSNYSFNSNFDEKIKYNCIIACRNQILLLNFRKLNVEEIFSLAVQEKKIVFLDVGCLKSTELNGENSFKSQLEPFLLKAINNEWLDGVKKIGDLLTSNSPKYEKSILSAVVAILSNNKLNWKENDNIINIIETLISHIDIEQKYFNKKSDFNGYNIIHIIAHLGDYEFYEKFVEWKGRNFIQKNIKAINSEVNASNTYKDYTPVLIALIKFHDHPKIMGYKNIAKALMELGVDLSKKKTIPGEWYEYNALHLISCISDTELAKTAISKTKHDNIAINAYIERSNGENPGFTPLLLALRKENYIVAKEFVQHPKLKFTDFVNKEQTFWGIIKTRDWYCYNSFHIAVYKKNVDFFNEVLNKENKNKNEILIAINTPIERAEGENPGHTALTMAVSHSRDGKSEEEKSSEKIIQKMVDYGITPYEIETTIKNNNYVGYNALHIAVKLNNVTVVKAFSEIKNISFSIDKRINNDENQLTPLLMAAINKQTEIFKILFKMGANYSNYVNKGDFCGYNALHITSWFGEYNCVNMIIKNIEPNFRSESINTKTNIDGYTALMLSILHHYNEVSKLLISNGADPSLSATGKDAKWYGYNALQIASYHNQGDVVNKILSSGHLKVEKATTDTVTGNQVINHNGLTARKIAKKQQASLVRIEFFKHDLRQLETLQQPQHKTKITYLNGKIAFFNKDKKAAEKALIELKNLNLSDEKTPKWLEKLDTGGCYDYHKIK